MSAQRLTASCSCGAVEIEAMGTPIVVAICFCDDCQAAARRIEAMPGAAPFRQNDGGTPLVVYRKDRVRWTRGEKLLTKFKLRDGSPTNRRLATCCNSVMLLDFDDTKFWADIYGARIQGTAPKPEMLICTKFAPETPANPDRLPSYSRHAPKFILRLLAARAAMLFSR
jgi:hypothetical protein